ncbi:hypothetical protein JNW91_15815 [Micromonospora sp. STR1_7]|uniref:DUF6919 domain-containing protein n=1 Tax=Micromonospora parastrephiae TaxID=2806101 RepID=A0ABS1XVA2_9ACTN|nr:hypothetical protein [Micromonospora parastrephiae]MBM0233202.1 hypothetical protein [Micromonospora parastrephiae]
MTLTWDNAKSLAELGELTARWLTGDLDETPTHGGPPDEETGPLVPLLAAVNRAGFVTDFSQPGEIDSGWQQRASVCGYCDDATLDRLITAFTPTDLVLLHERTDSGIRLPVTLNLGTAHTWVGGSPGVDYWDDQCSPATVRLLAGCWYVTLVDPIWGRDDHLWPTLAAALNLPAPVAAGQ